MTVERSMAERSRMPIVPFSQEDEDKTLTLADQTGQVTVTAAATATINTIMPPVAESAGLFFCFRVSVAVGEVWQLFSAQDDECNPNEDLGWMLLEMDNSGGGSELQGYVVEYSDGLRWWAIEAFSQEI